VRTDEIERAGVQRKLGGLRQRPAKPRGGKTEGRGCRHRHGLARIDMPQQDRADAVDERVTRCEHAHVTAPLRQHFLDGFLEGTAPRPRGAADERRGKGKMSLTAEHDLCCLHETSGNRR